MECGYFAADSSAREGAITLLKYGRSRREWQPFQQAEGCQAFESYEPRPV